MRFFSYLTVAGCLLSPDQSDVLLVVSDLKAVYPPGDLVEFDCPNGYHLSGSATRYCQSNFLWSGQQPTCILEDHDIGKNIISVEIQTGTNSVQEKAAEANK